MKRIMCLTGLLALFASAGCVLEDGHHYGYGRGSAYDDYDRSHGHGEFPRHGEDRGYERDYPRGDRDRY